MDIYYLLRTLIFVNLVISFNCCLAIRMCFIVI